MSYYWPLVGLCCGLVMFAGASCSVDVQDDTGSTIQFSTDSLPSYSLQGRIFSDTDSLASPDGIAIGQQYILVADSKNLRPFLVFDRETGAVIASAGGRGEGPGDTSWPTDLDFRNGRDQGWLFDFPSRTLHHVDLTILVRTKVLTGKIVKLDGEGTPISPAWIAGDSIASVGFYGPGRLALYDGEGTFHRMAGPSPPGESSTPMHIRHHAYHAMLRPASDGRRIAVASIYSDRLEIYDRGELQAVVRGPKFHEPDYTVFYGSQGPASLALTSETRVAYLALSVTDKLIFGLYCGTATVASSPKDSDIIVFTWIGTPIAVLDLGGDPVGIAVSVDGRELYAVFHSPIPMIVRYSVPDLS